MEKDPVVKKLNELTQNSAHNKIFNTVGTRETDSYRVNPIVSCKYECIKNTCLFFDCFQKIKDNNKLEELGAKNFCTKVIQDISNFHDDWLPTQVDGYLINKCGITLVELKKEIVLPEPKIFTPESYNVTGIIEYNNLRKYFMKPLL